MTELQAEPLLSHQALFWRRVKPIVMVVPIVAAIVTSVAVLQRNDSAAAFCTKYSGLPTPERPVLFLGDSAIEHIPWEIHVPCGSIMYQTAIRLDEKAGLNAVGGARMLGSHGTIPDQYTDDKDWSWVVISGGGNDLFLHDSCHKGRGKPWDPECVGFMDKIIKLEPEASQGATGAVPDLVSRCLAHGSKVLLLSYWQVPTWSPLEIFQPASQEVMKRYRAMAEQMQDVHHLNISDFIDGASETFKENRRDFDDDGGTHLSAIGAAKVAAAVAKLIRESS
jgi:hypothetical protein